MGHLSSSTGLPVLPGVGPLIDHHTVKSPGMVGDTQMQNATRKRLRMCQGCIPQESAAHEYQHPGSLIAVAVGAHDLPRTSREFRGTILAPVSFLNGNHMGSTRLRQRFQAKKQLLVHIAGKTPTVERKISERRSRRLSGDSTAPPEIRRHSRVPSELSLQLP